VISQLGRVLFQVLLTDQLLPNAKQPGGGGNISPAELKKEGNRKRGKVSFPILRSPSEARGITVFRGRDTWWHGSRLRFRAPIMEFHFVPFPLTASPKNS